MEIFPAERLTTGYSWTECPRWHDGAFYFSDMYNRRVVKVAENGTAEVFLDLSQREPLDGQDVVLIGTGFLPDGRMLVNSMHERVVLVYDGADVSLYADLRGLATGPINDMVVDANGRAYVTQLGFELWQGEAPKESYIMIVEPDGTARDFVEAGPMMGANGIALSADGRTLVTAEAFANRIAAVDLDADGGVTGRRLFAEVAELPDGMCLDAEGAAWVAQPTGAGAIRILDGGEVVAKVTVPAEEAGNSVACVLGGPDRSSLYLCCGFEVFDADKSRREGQGSIWRADVPVGAGEARP
ncbi:SMP-30/gluconolactonase/LRE family protein [Nonomuraea bangladeshensis]|uniref:SMP-30/gluconolactonase/LRE family protein n=1 Tax=Nonomuraea bangladeshensis TaxID=404385 RepID=UPI003C2B5A14